MKKMKTLFITLILVISSVMPVFAADGKVNYNGNAREFIFEPGSKYSPTDLFPNFKNVMPGDSIAQKITVKNDASNRVKVKIYMRSLGAHAESEEFLSKLKLRVEKSEDNEMAYMFDAAASETAQLTDWVCLGTLYSGGEVNLNVVLDVPVELDNEYSQQIGYLDWEFKVEEFPIEDDDPTPQTGDNANITLWVIGICVAAVILIFIFWCKKKEKNQN